MISISDIWKLQGETVFWQSSYSSIYKHDCIIVIDWLLYSIYGSLEYNN